MSRWTRPEDILQRWQRGGAPVAPEPSAARTPSAGPDPLDRPEALTAALGLLALGHLNASRWVFTLCGPGPADALAVRSLCHGSYEGQTLRMPIEILDLAAGGPDTGAPPPADPLTDRIRRHLRGGAGATPGRAEGTQLFVRLGQVPAHPELLAGRLAGLDHGVAGIWLIGDTRPGAGDCTVQRLCPDPAGVRVSLLVAGARVQTCPIVA